MQKPVENTAIPAKWRTALLAEADAAYEQMCESGEAYEAAEVHRYIHAFAGGESAERPEPKPWRE